MSLAFHVMAHAQPGHVSRLLEAIWTPEHSYVLHYDRRRPAAEHAAIRALTVGRPNVIVQSPRRVLWGRFSLFQAQYEGLKLALASAPNWTHWINLSGACYPIRPVDRIADELVCAGECSYVRYFQPLQGGDWACPEKRLRYYYLDLWWLEGLFRMRGLGRRLRRIFGGGVIPRWPGLTRPLPTDFTWHGGDNWVILSRSAATLLTGSALAQRLVAALRHSEFPEESLFQSILLNSPLASTVINDHGRLINWQPGLGSPLPFEEQDWPRLVEAAEAGRWFARKFDFTNGRALLDRIDAQLLQPSSCS